MAVKDYGTPNKGRQLMYKGKDQAQGLDDKTNYGYNQFAELSDGDPNASTRLSTHDVLHNAAPGKDFWNAPLGTLYRCLLAGSAVVYVKRVLPARAAAARFDDWSSLNMTVQAGD
jgi:hypothetical protein